MARRTLLDSTTFVLASSCYSRAKVSTLICHIRVRAAPLQVGAVGLALAAVNRILFVLGQEADRPVGAAARRLAAAAEGSQTRTDVICVAASATLILTGLVWKSVQARKPVEVELNGMHHLYACHD